MCIKITTCFQIKSTYKIFINFSLEESEHIECRLNCFLLLHSSLIIFYMFFIEKMQPGGNEETIAFEIGPIGEISLGKLTQLGVRNVLVNVKQNQGYNKLIPSKKISKYQNIFAS